jgi:hypothetical protein
VGPRYFKTGGVMRITKYRNYTPGKSGYYGAIDYKLLRGTKKDNYQLLDEMRQWCHDNNIQGGWSCDNDLRICFSNEHDMTHFLLRWGEHNES